MRNIEKIYCDFDGTITKKDAVNTFFEEFASPKWTESEELWRQGKITSKENAIIQVELVKNLSEADLNNFINTIEIDKYFIDFCKLLSSKNIELIILSDGFDMFIKKTLERYNLSGIRFYANHIYIDNNRLKIEFPHYNKKCDIGSGMCKCNMIKNNKFIYIGDGVSDLCVAKKASTLFATKSLLNYCEIAIFHVFPLIILVI